jgi:hypothetical protein
MGRGVDVRMNARLRLLCTTVLVCAAAPQVARADAPPPAADAARRCPACVVAAPELIDIAGAALIGAGAGEAIEAASQAVRDTGAVHTGVRASNHPDAFRALIRWARGNTASGRAVWRAAGGRLGRVYKWLRRTYTLRKLKRRLPRAAVACVISGTVTGLRTGSIEQAGWSCLGGALGALGSA